MTPCGASDTARGERGRRAALCMNTGVSSFIPGSGHAGYSIRTRRQRQLLFMTNRRNRPTAARSLLIKLTFASSGVSFLYGIALPLTRRSG